MSFESQNIEQERAPGLVKVRRLDQSLQSSVNSVRLTGLSALVAVGLGMKADRAMPRVFADPEYIRSHLASLDSGSTLDVTTLCDEPLDYLAEVERMTGQKLTGNESAASYMLPPLIAQWLTSSRRVYHVHEDLQLQLMATKLGDIKWDDITFPFDSFGVSIDVPIRSPENAEYDFMLFNIIKNVPGRNILSVTLLPTGLESIHTPSKLQLSRIKEAIDKKNYKAAMAIGLVESKKMDAVGIVYGNIFEDLSLDATVEDTIRDHKRGDIGYEYALRVGLGTLLYMAQKGQKGTAPVREANNVNVEPKGSIANLADVFTVRSSKRITREQYDVLYDAVVRDGGKRGIVSSHFRAGHWRRPKGTGWNPLQEATVWVSPTIVNRVEGQLPLGVEIKVNALKP